MYDDRNELKLNIDVTLKITNPRKNPKQQRSFIFELVPVALHDGEAYERLVFSYSEKDFVDVIALDESKEQTPTISDYFYRSIPGLDGYTDPTPAHMR